MHARPLLISIVVAIACCGCQSLSADDETPVTATSLTSGLMVKRPWAVSDFPLSVCFDATGNGDQVDRDEVREAVESSWAAASCVVSFTGWRTCTRLGSDIKVFVDSSIETGLSPLGTDSRGGTMRVPSRAGQPDAARRRYTIIHEFGHALGISHEHWHPENPYPAAEICVWNGDVADPGAIPVGGYDHFSIMNYCTGLHGDFWPDELYAADVENIRQMYPIEGRVHSPLLIGTRQQICELSHCDPSLTYIYGGYRFNQPEFPTDGIESGYLPVECFANDEVFSGTTFAVPFAAVAAATIL